MPGRNAAKKESVAGGTMSKVSQEAFRKMNDVISAAIENRKYKIDVKKDKRDKDIYIAFFDSVGHRIIVSMYYGSRIQKSGAAVAAAAAAAAAVPT